MPEEGDERETYIYIYMFIEIERVCVCVQVPDLFWEEHRLWNMSERQLYVLQQHHIIQPTASNI